ncbi:hypothetical protein [Corallococcus silvisoli]|uniref:hypothetical protein n=1 Tax=Corallococcus silvisoli TaxID=2697031 RepID=UPI00191C0D91|nr:hypothetical protein [Corallococcus silvisoli]
MRPVLCCLWLYLLGVPAVARAASYEVEPEDTGEAALFALREDGAITAETLAALLVLRRSGVDPAHASRAALYALPGLTYARVDGLLEGTGSAGVVPSGLAPLAREERTSAAAEVRPESLAFESRTASEANERRRPPLVSGGRAGLTAEERRKLAPFLMMAPSDRVSGDARLLTAFAVSDPVLPPLALQVRVAGPEGWRVGLLTSMTRRRLGTVHRDASQRRLVAEAPGVSVVMPKFHGQWMGERASVLVGAYRLGFAQRLTLDTTGLPTPDGFLPDDAVRVPGDVERWCFLGEGACTPEERAVDVTPDFHWEEGFRGVVGTVRGAVGTDAELSATGFGSYQSRSLLSHALMDRASCEGSRCKAPAVWLAGEKTPMGRVVSRSLPGVFREWAGGGHATLSWTPRAQVGATAWGALPVWSVEGASLDFRSTAGYPAGGAFGAVGVDGAWGHGPVDLFVEAARTFDAAPGGGGGFGVLQRTVVAGAAQELEVSLRAYGRGFANPYTGAMSGPDELEGSRARNEVGARVRYLHRLEGALRLRGEVDAWTLPSDGAVVGSAGTVNLRASARVDWRVHALFQPSLWGEYRDKDVGVAGDCFDGSAEAPCSGSLLRMTARVKAELHDALTVAAQYAHARVDDPVNAGVRVDAQAVVEAQVRPCEAVRLRGRAVWKDEDLSTRHRLEQSFRATLDASWAAGDAVTTRARYAWRIDLKDARGARTPPDAPRHLFALEVETRF